MMSQRIHPSFQRLQDSIHVGLIYAALHDPRDDIRKKRLNNTHSMCNTYASLACKHRLNTDETVLERKGLQFRRGTLGLKSSQIIATLHGKYEVLNVHQQYNMLQLPTKSFKQSSKAEGLAKCILRCHANRR